jgi:light-regulated signal transduction histidine kinase (bacteriophytochrome)
MVASYLQLLQSRHQRNLDPDATEFIWFAVDGARRMQALMPEVRIDAQRGEGEWVITVTDNGMGIEPRHAERIFMVFKRLHPASEYPGTGIGLSICRKIVERHDGRIWMDSVPGSGSSFHFTVPDRVRARGEGREHGPEVTAKLAGRSHTFDAHAEALTAEALTR